MELRHARDFAYQALPLFLCNVEKIREPGDEARLVGFSISPSLIPLKLTDGASLGIC